MGNYRPLVVFRQNYLLLDGLSVMEMAQIGTPIPRETLAKLTDCSSAYWLMPRGREPFAVPSVYAPELNIFGKEVPEAFRRTHAITETTRFFDVWACRGPMLNPK